MIAQVQKDIRKEFKIFEINDVWIGSTSEIQNESKTTTRKIFVLTEERFHNLLFDNEFDEELDILIVDEAQKVSDESRGILLEEVVEEAVNRFEKLQIVFISPFSKNPGNFRIFFNALILKLKRQFVTVSQNILKLDITKTKYSLKLLTTKSESTNEIPIDEGDILSGDFQAIPSKDWEFLAVKKFGSESNIIYCNSPKSTVDLGIALSYNS